METVILDGGYRVATGLQPMTDADMKLTANLMAFNEDWLWTENQIKDALQGTGGEQRYKKDRSKRAHRVRNQDRLGKCNASANASAYEQGRETQGFAHIAISDCFTYMQVNGGVDEGCALPRTFENIKTAGLCPYRIQVGGVTKMFPNNAFNKRQVAPDVYKQAVIEAKNHRALNVMRLPLDDFELFCRAAATAIARRAPIVWAWHVGSQGSRLKNGFMQLGKGIGNHANLIHSGKWVGGKTLVNPDNQNSWGPTADAIYGPKGPSWGEGGFALTTMEGLYSCVQYHPPYIIISVEAEEGNEVLDQF